ncbi:acidic phospholipase A2 2-like [Branchiostoma floridae]|uniref:Phospholipase A2 n=1 Tax=Branchiostoma floridae TaxID=7739 RepID=A0A9J7MLZ6_BRAFL|nr:acidic phospholipase A2 2-like [Branchiostoma floridae]
MWSSLLVFSAVIARPALTQESTDVLGDNTRPAQEKNLLQFAKMIWTVTGRNPLDYNNYGCYCGHGGAGTPVDDIDRCCQAHDRCYDTVDYPKFTTYTFTAARGTVTCLDAVGCNERAVCECDRDAVLCLNRYAYTGKKTCVQTTTPTSPTIYPPEPTTTYLTTPPGPTPVGCDFDGQFYPPGTTIQDNPGCFGHVIICDEDGELRHGDYFGHGCCEHDGQYYEDGETIITADGVFCYCEGSDTDEAAPMICGGKGFL